MKCKKCGKEIISILHKCNPFQKVLSELKTNAYRLADSISDLQDAIVGEGEIDA